MAFELAKAFVELNAKGFGTVMGAINGVQKGLGSLVSVATGPLGLAFGALGAGAGAAGLISMASNAEQLEVAFGTMLGSADAAKSMIGNLTEFAKKTPFELPGVTQAARTLMSFGHEQDQVIPLLQVLGDVSAGTGKDLGELAVIFGQISATGKLTGGDLMQLTNAGVPILKVLGDQLGKTTGEVKQMVESGEISAGMVTKAFQSMGQEGGIFAGMMEKQSSTLGGLWSTLKDSVGQGMLAIGQALVEGFDLKTVVANFTSFVDTFRNEWMPTIVDSMRWVGDNLVKPFFSAIGSVTQVVFNFVRDLDLYWEYASASIGNWMNNFYQIISTGMSNSWSITKWFFSNFIGITQNAIMSIQQLFMQHIEQIKNNWISLLKFFATGKLEFDFTPMKKAAEMIFEGIEMPKFEVAQLDALKGDLDAIAGRLAKRQSDRQAKQIKDQTATKELKNQELKIDEAQTKEKEKQRQASFSSLAELADKMQQAAFGKGKSAGSASTSLADAGSQLVSNQKAGQSAGLDSVSRQIAILESLLALAQGQGLRVVPQESGQIKLPSASVQFGAQGA